MKYVFALKGYIICPAWIYWGDTTTQEDGIYKHKMGQKPKLYQFIALNNVYANHMDCLLLCIGNSVYSIHIANKVGIFLVWIITT